MVDLIHEIHSRGWAPATSTNFSFRIPGTDGFFISASGLDKGVFREEDFVHVDMDGDPFNDDRKTSAETLLHVLIYRMDPEVACIVHSHSVLSAVLSRLSENEGKIRISGWEVLKAIEGISTHEARISIPVFANSQDMEWLSAGIRQYWEEHPHIKAFLLSGHGLYTWGKDIKAAKRHLEAFEYLLECHHTEQKLKRS